MTCSGTLARLVATVLVPALAWATVPAATAPATGTITGHVLAAGSLAPLKGVQVHVGDPKTGEVRSSTATGDDGSFSVSGLAPSKYEIAVQSSQTLYVAGGSVALAAGETRAVQVAVNQQTAPSPNDKEKKDRGGTAWWNNPFTATLIVLGSAVLIGVLVDQATDDEETPASPSAR